MVEQRIDDLYASDVIDVSGKKIGGVGQVYLDDQTGQPTWVTVKSGLFGTKENFVPLEKATVTPGRITVAFSSDYVKDAPGIDPDRHLNADEEAELYRYYTAPPADAGAGPDSPDQDDAIPLGQSSS